MVVDKKIIIENYFLLVPTAGKYRLGKTTQYSFKAIPGMGLVGSLDSGHGCFQWVEVLC